MQVRLILLLTFAAFSAKAEWVFHAPYLGQAVGLPGQASVPSREIAEATKRADLIVITRSLELNTADSKSYRGRHEVVEVLKGRRESLVELDWKPSATGIKPGSKHLFFLKQLKGEGHLEVLKEIYIHAEGFPCCRTYGAMDGGTAATLAVIRFLIDSSQDQGLEAAREELLREVRKDHAHRQHTAVLLALELDHVSSLPALRYAVENRVEGFIPAVYELCRLDGSKGTRAALALVGEVDRYQEAQVFDAIARAKNQESVALLIELGNRDPKRRVSCAFAIREVNSKGLADAVAKWEADGKHTGQVEKLNGSGFIPTRLTSDLLKLAVEGEMVDPNGFASLDPGVLKKK